MQAFLLASDADGRSREGAWIEMENTRLMILQSKGRSREGAWIEIPLAQAQKMSGLGRSREGAWIEILGFVLSFLVVLVSLPRGSVD